MKWYQKLARKRKPNKPVPDYFRGQVYLAPNGWLMVRVPYELAYGLYQALPVPAKDLPRYQGQFVPHITLARADELEGVDPNLVAKLIGQELRFYPTTMWRVRPRHKPDHWLWAVEVDAPEFATMRRALGLPELVEGFQRPHITFALAPVRALEKGARWYKRLAKFAAADAKLPALAPQQVPQAFRGLEPGMRVVPVLDPKRREMRPPFFGARVVFSDSPAAREIRRKLDQLRNELRHIQQARTRGGVMLDRYGSRGLAEMYDRTRKMIWSMERALLQETLKNPTHTSEWRDPRTPEEWAELQNFEQWRSAPRAERTDPPLRVRPMDDLRRTIYLGPEHPARFGSPVGEWDTSLPAGIIGPPPVMANRPPAEPVPDKGGGFWQKLLRKFNFSTGKLKGTIRHRPRQLKRRDRQGH